MANLNAPSGLAPVMHIDGSSWNGQARLYAVIAGDTNSYYCGDVVKIDATNFADSNGINYVTRATAGATVRGVVVGVGAALPYGFQGGPYINPANLTQGFRPSGAQSQNYYLAVVDDPDVIFEVMEDTTSTPGQAAQMTKNANFTAANPAANTYVSGFTLNSSTYATTSTLNLKVLQPSQRNDNTPFTAYQRLLVMLNNHDFHVGTAGY